MPKFTSVLAASLASLVLVSFSLPAMAEGRGESASVGGSHGSDDSRGSQQGQYTSSLFDPEDCSRDLVNCQTWRKELSKANNRTDRIVRAAEMAKQDALVRDAIAQYARDGNDEAIEALQVLGLLGLLDRAHSGDVGAQGLLNGLSDVGSEAAQQVLAENDAPWFRPVNRF